MRSFGGVLRSNSPAISAPFGEISDPTEQGLFPALTGNIFAATGNNRDFAWRRRAARIKMTAIGSSQEAHR
jgi:hypothetical protein